MEQIVNEDSIVLSKEKWDRIQSMLSDYEELKKRKRINLSFTVRGDTPYVDFSKYHPQFVDEDVANEMVFGKLIFTSHIDYDTPMKEGVQDKYDEVLGEIKKHVDTKNRENKAYYNMITTKYVKLYKKIPKWVRYLWKIEPE